MTIRKVSGRQFPLVAEIEFDISTLLSGTPEDCIDLPANATVIGGEVVVTTASDAGTSDVLDVGDADSGNRYVNDVDLKTVGRTALVPTGYRYPAAKSVRLSRTAVGTAATTLAGYVRVQYTIKDRAQDVQP